MMIGLIEGEEKMSKSNPNSAIFMEDTEKEIIKKINQSYCPPKEVEKNPCFEYIKYIVFPALGKLEISRPKEYGGDK